MFSYINDNTPKEELVGCKKITQKVLVECIESYESKPPTFWDKHPDLDVILFVNRGRGCEFKEMFTISGDSIEELEQIKQRMKESFQKKYSNCNVEVIDY